MKSRSVLLLIVSAFLHKEVWCFLNLIGKNTVLQNTQAKHYEYEELQKYLSGLIAEAHLPSNLTLKFPKSLNHEKYQLMDGNVDRFYDPINPHGSFDSVLFHQLDGEFYGVTQVYGPKIDFSFKYQSNLLGTPETGSFSVIVNHDPLELQMDFGEKAAGNCVVDRNRNNIHFFFDKQLKATPKLNPDSPSGLAEAEALLKEITLTWLPDLYLAIMKVKFEQMIEQIKGTMLDDSKSRKNLDRICKQVVYKIL